MDSKAGADCVEILDKTIRWNDHWYDDTIEKITERIQNNNSNGIIYIEYQYYQIGLDNEWLRNISNKIGDKLTVRREILLQRLHGSSLSPYPREDIEYITSTMHDPIDTLVVNDFYEFDIYEALDPLIPYIVGVDCSTGTASDNNAITIINPYTVRPAAEFKNPYIGETKYEDLIESLVLQHIPRAIVVIERNSVGDGIIDHLLAESKIANRLYFDRDKDLLAEKMRRAETVESLLATKAKEKTFYGVYTQGQSRDDMFAILSRHVNEKKDDFVTKNIITDLSGLVRSPSGKILAGPGGAHDDSIMSYLIGLYVYYHGNNLDYFGFYKTDIYEGAPELNSGLSRARISDVLPRDVVEKMERDKELEKELDFESIYRDAVLKSQQESRNLSQSRFMQSNNVFDNTPKALINRTDEDSMDLSFFDTMNGF